MTRRSGKYDFDLIAIGSGSGGAVGATHAAKAGKKVAIVEHEKRLGGECPNWACVPTKALLSAAESMVAVRESTRFGIKPTTVSYDYKRVRAWKDLVVERTGTEHAEELFNDHGIKVLHGRAHFIDPHTISVDGKRYRARRFLIASGTHNFIPPIEGLEEAGYITFKEAIDLSHPPKSLFIIGGGPIGCEFAELFSSFDTKVHLIEMAPRLLGHEEPEVADLIRAVFEHRKVSVTTNGTIHSISKKGSKKVVYYSDGVSSFTAEVDEVLVAAGKRPNVDLGLENAGVGYDKHGIKTNKFLQTSASHIYAAGDVVGPYQFTHTASYQSLLASNNMFKKRANRVPADYTCIPRCVFTTPEVASVGMTEEELKKYKMKPRVAIVETSLIGRANTSNQFTGLVKVIANSHGTIMGAAIVAPRAGEMIHELALAIRLGATAHDVASMVHAFPTWSEAVKLACAKLDHRK